MSALELEQRENASISMNALISTMPMICWPIVEQMQNVLTPSDQSLAHVTQARTYYITHRTAGPKNQKS